MSAAARAALVFDRHLAVVLQGAGAVGVVVALVFLAGLAWAGLILGVVAVALGTVLELFPRGDRRRAG